RFTTNISLAAHQQAADYTVARTRLAFAGTLVDSAFVVGMTLLGGLALIDHVAASWSAQWNAPRLVEELSVIAAAILTAALLDIPMSWYRHFRLEARFGFSRITAAVFVADLAKGLLVAVLLGTPVAAVTLWLMDSAGPWWWLYAWLVWMGFQVL